VSDLVQASSLLTPALGGAASKLFAVGLLASGQQATLTCTIAGQVVLEGFLGPGAALKPWARRQWVILQQATQRQAEAWLASDVSWAVQCVNMYVKIALTQGEFDSLCDFVFNLGSGSFQHSALLTLVNQRNFEAAAAEFEKWDHAGGQVVAGLLRRRIAEEAEFKS
jgi:GH24 family phage-related lysozyme (muramidase)